METILELSPLQIALTRYKVLVLPRMFQDKNLKEIIEKHSPEMMKSLLINGIDNAAHITRININPEANSPYTKYIEDHCREFFDESSPYFLLLWSAKILSEIKKFLHLSETQTTQKHLKTDFIIEDRSNFLSVYLQSLSITEIIDILSNHLPNLVIYILNIHYRKILNSDDALNKALHDFNLIITPIPQLRQLITEKLLDGQFWTCSRHLELVENKFIDMKTYQQMMSDAPSSDSVINREKGENGELLNFKSQDLEDLEMFYINVIYYIKELVDRIKEYGGHLEEELLQNTKRNKRLQIDNMITAIKEKIRENGIGVPKKLEKDFIEYVLYCHELNILKELDAQIQVRREYLLKKFLEYLKTDHNYGFFWQSINEKEDPIKRAEILAENLVGRFLKKAEAGSHE